MVGFKVKVRPLANFTKWGVGGRGCVFVGTVCVRGVFGCILVGGIMGWDGVVGKGGVC